jgi:hypothetical protein
MYSIIYSIKSITAFRPKGPKQGFVSPKGLIEPTKKVEKVKRKDDKTSLATIDFDLAISKLPEDILERYSTNTIKIFIAIRKGLKPPLTLVKYLTVQGREYKHTGTYRCFCGNLFEANVYNVSRGNTKSCGCFKSFIQATRKHGRRTKADKDKDPLKPTSTNPTKQAWLDLDKDDVVPAWLSYGDFFEDMYIIPSPYDWYIEKKDPLKPHGPSNSYWKRKEPLKRLAASLYDLILSNKVCNKPSSRDI